MKLTNKIKEKINELNITRPDVCKYKRSRATRCLYHRRKISIFCGHAPGKIYEETFVTNFLNTHITGDGGNMLATIHTS